MTKRMTIDQAVKLIEEADLKELGKMALARKKELHPKGVTTFVVDRNINYTNVCWVDCKFCAFYRHEKNDDAYILTYEEIDHKIDELLAIGGTQILFQGGVHPKLEIEWYEELVYHIHSKYPEVTIHGFSAIEIDYIATRSQISIREVLQRLHAKGLASISGAGAEILSDRVRDIIAPKKLDKDTWLEVHREAHKLGIKSTVTMMYGTVETDREIRVAVREDRLQLGCPISPFPQRLDPAGGHQEAASAPTPGERPDPGFETQFRMSSAVRAPSTSPSRITIIRSWFPVRTAMTISTRGRSASTAGTSSIGHMISNRGTATRWSSESRDTSATATTPTRLRPRTTGNAVAG